MTTKKQAKLLKEFGYDSEQIEKMSNKEARNTIIIERGSLNRRQHRIPSSYQASKKKAKKMIT